VGKRFLVKSTGTFSPIYIVLANHSKCLFIVFPLYYALIAIFLFATHKNSFPVPKAFLVTIVGFLFLSFLFIGHIIPNLGAIIRYRSIYLPFILTPLMGYLFLPNTIKLKNKII